MANRTFGERNPGWRPGFLILALILLPHAATADDRWPQVDPQAVRAHVTFLADDLLEGRAAGTRGYDLAARFVAAQMALMGLEPAGSSGTWLQPVSIVESTRVLPAARAVIRRGRSDTVLAPSTDFIPLPGFLEAQASVEAPMAFVGFGISAPEFGYDDFQDFDLAGKVAVVFNGVPAAIPPELRDFYVKQKGRQLAERGAVGIVQLTTAEEASREPWDRTLAQARAGRMRLLDTDGRPVDTYPGLEAGIVVNVAAAQKLFAGEPRSFDEVWATARAGRTASFAMKASIAIATRSSLRRFESPNVVGVLKGSDPKLRDEHVVLMAHLDHVGRGAPVNGDGIYNGALDNASGVAIMLEAARAIAASPERPRRSIVFLATTAEERGLLGSRHYALYPTVPKASIVAALNLDMPVALYPAAGQTVIGRERSTLGEPARVALEAEGLRALPNLAPERGLFTYTDQYSFVREGIPSLYLHDGPVSADPAINAQKVFDDYLATHYHRVTDDLSLPIDWALLARLAQVHARLCLAIANSPERPRWSPGDFFGQRFGGH
jgi:hypothetical protein